MPGFPLQAVHALLLFFLPVSAVFAMDDTIGWMHYGNDPGGLRYGTAALITADNIAGVRQQWLYHTGDPVPPTARRRNGHADEKPTVVKVQRQFLWHSLPA